MDQRSKWIVFGLVVTGVVTVGCLILALLGAALGWGVSGSSVPQMRGDRMGGMCPWCGGTGYQLPWRSVGSVGIVLAVTALALGLLALLILGGIWLTRSTTFSPSPKDRSRACPSCGEEVESGWKVCPHCGERLAE